MIHGVHQDPHTILGLHEHSGGRKVIRLWRPGANRFISKFLGKLSQQPECMTPESLNTLCRTISWPITTVFITRMVCLHMIRMHFYLHLANWINIYLARGALPTLPCFRGASCRTAGCSRGQICCMGSRRTQSWLWWVISIIGMDVSIRCAVLGNLGSGRFLFRG